jgi:hypothetical protein
MKPLVFLALVRVCSLPPASCFFWYRPFHSFAFPEADFMKRKTNEALGVILMVLALVLAFLAWQINPALGITAFALFFIGAHLFYTERAQRRALAPPAEQGSRVPHENDFSS